MERANSESSDPGKRLLAAIDQLGLSQSWRYPRWDFGVNGFSRIWYAGVESDFGGMI